MNDCSKVLVRAQAFKLLSLRLQLSNRCVNSFESAEFQAFKCIGTGGTVHAHPASYPQDQGPHAKPSTRCRCQASNAACRRGRRKPSLLCRCGDPRRTNRDRNRIHDEGTVSHWNPLDSHMPGATDWQFSPWPCPWLQLPPPVLPACHFGALFFRRSRRPWRAVSRSVFLPPGSGGTRLAASATVANQQRPEVGMPEVKLHPERGGRIVGTVLWDLLRRSTTNDSRRDLAHSSDELLRCARSTT